jgi:hypothetical protein
VLQLVHLSSTALGPGSIVLPGNWGRVFGVLGWKHNRSVLEMALEASRKRVSPGAPSRLEAAFLCPTMQASANYLPASFLFPDGETMALPYEVELVDPQSPSILAYWHMVSPSPGSPLTDDWSDAYWATAVPLSAWQTIGDLNSREVLTTSALRIVRPLSLTGNRNTGFVIS